MTSRQGWLNERNDRSLRYAGRVLPQDRPILLRLPSESARSYDGQVSVIVAATLLSRMTPAVAFDVPAVDIAAPLPWTGSKLPDRLCEIAFAADPGGAFEARGARDGDYILTFGKSQSVATVHGSGWNAFVGPSESSLPDSLELNPIGPALASIVAVARLFALQMKPLDGPHLLNAFNWKNEIAHPGMNFDATRDLGSIWSIGTGSVGTAALYFLTLATHQFSSALFDMDFAKIHNLDRSPIFTARDADLQTKKVHATAAYLRSLGVRDVTPEPEPLDKSDIWLSRQAGMPDIVIAAANERDVRSLIERSMPPLQIYGTTGANWEASVIRHIPLVDACSCCLFPPNTQELPTVCATGETKSPTGGEAVDAALPFLSFAAGLMAAAEILKASLPGYPFSPSRTTLYTHPQVQPRFVSSNLALRPGCLCGNRRSSVHGAMTQGSRYERLSRLQMVA
jgi:hypothetical protein